MSDEALALLLAGAAFRPGKRVLSTLGCINAAFSGAPIASGTLCVVVVPYDCTIRSAVCLSTDGASGDVELNVYKSTYAEFPSTNAISPTFGITGDVKSQDGILAGWSKTLKAGEILTFEVSSSTLNQVNVSLLVERT